MLADNVEGAALPLLDQLADDGLLQVPGQRLYVAGLLASIVVRGYAFRDKLIATGLEVGEQYLLAHPHAERSVREEQLRHRDGTRAVGTAFEVVWPLVVSWLGSMCWQVIDAPQATLATSDQPLLSYDAATGRTVGSFLSPGSIDAVLFALRPDRLLVASWQAGPDEGGFTAPEHLVPWFNAQQLLNAKYHFIEPPGRPADTADADIRMRSKWTRDSTRLDAAWRAVAETQSSDDSIVFAVATGSGAYRSWRSPPAA